MGNPDPVQPQVVTMPAKPAPLVTSSTSEQAPSTAVLMPDEQRAANREMKATAKNTVKTPSELPSQPPPANFAPPADEEHEDAEGNKIAIANGHWYLAGPPKTLSFPVAPGGKHELLPINPAASYAALLATVMKVEAEQIAHADALGTDMKHWFARVYSYVTRFELEAIAAGTYQYPHMKLQEVAQFHAAYKANYEAWDSGHKDKVEAHWCKAFEAAESASKNAAMQSGGNFPALHSLAIKDALMPSMEAHIRFDLPRALATCFELHYDGIPGTALSDFKQDFDAMQPVFDKAQGELLSEIKDDTNIADIGRYGVIQDLGFPFFFNIPEERQHTWEKASLLARGMREGQTNAHYIARLKAHERRAHESVAEEEVSVDGTNVVDDVNWMNQPGAHLDAAAPTPTHAKAPPVPEFPSRLYFQQGRGQGADKLEDAIREDQDLAPFVKLAEWTRQVRGAVILIEGHASLEGDSLENASLAASRAFLFKSFLWHTGADDANNHVSDIGWSTTGADATPSWRFVSVRVVDAGVARQQKNAPNVNLPSEVK